MAAPPFRSATEFGRSPVTTTQHDMRMANERRNETAPALDYGTRIQNDRAPTATLDRSNAVKTGV